MNTMQRYKTVTWSWNNIDSIKKAEKKKARLEKLGFRKVFESPDSLAYYKKDK